MNRPVHMKMLHRGLWRLSFRVKLKITWDEQKKMKTQTFIYIGFGLVYELCFAVFL